MVTVQAKLKAKQISTMSVARSIRKGGKSSLVIMVNDQNGGEDDGRPIVVVFVITPPLSRDGCRQPN